MGTQDNWVGRNPEKDQLRNSVWTALKESGAAAGDPFHAIPDFIGSEKAADLLRNLDEWKRSKVMMASPDPPQIPVRLNALRDGMIVYMAIPKLVDETCFVELTEDDIISQGYTLEEAAAWQGALKCGRPVTFEEMHPVDITVTGCVAVTRSGGRTGKGAGFADLEYSLMRMYGRINDRTPVITTVHPMMIVPEDRLPIQKHDTYLTMIITPEEIIRVERDLPQPVLDWDSIREDQIASIPFLKKLLEERKEDKR